MPWALVAHIGLDKAWPYRPTRKRYAYARYHRRYQRIRKALERAR